MTEPTDMLPRILVVDDEPLVVRMLNEVLKSRSVHEAHGRDRASELA